MGGGEGVKETLTLLERSHPNFCETNRYISFETKWTLKPRKIHNKATIYDIAFFYTWSQYTRHGKIISFFKLNWLWTLSTLIQCQTSNSWLILGKHLAIIRLNSWFKWNLYSPRTKAFGFNDQYTSSYSLYQPNVSASCGYSLNSIQASKFEIH